jgi:UDP-N-acetylmuramate dehydrogenase
MSDAIAHELSRLGEVLCGEPLGAYTTFQTGGPADILFHPRDRKSLVDAVRLIRAGGLTLTVIGGGSNLLVADAGVRGVVIRIAGSGEWGGSIECREDGRVYAEAGVDKEDFIEFCVGEGFGGVEFLAGMPGCIGGGIVMNAGTNLGTFADILSEVELIDTAGKVVRRKIERQSASYRDIGMIRIPSCSADFLRFPAPDPDAVRQAVERIIEERWQKHPLEYPSAGSVFKNPPGHSSWKLIDEAGLKGARVGGAMVSEKHTNFIINYDNATSADIRALIRLVQEEVRKRSGIRLEPEVRMIGEF